ncbi:hypothetical protein GIB67_023333 [Kingdonia uniflora]|uniref:AP2/ERF domain-containing protein n=1 Tax=Kingdonia uniflora TaxID=39325 RepID=A0A7J7LID9_9MAGN|nr:hypothetical protein GIB67_023333 [Kingdonia uniflora]
MDSSSSSPHQNWLSFSLSNNNNNNPDSSSPLHHLSLFQQHATTTDLDGGSDLFLGGATTTMVTHFPGDTHNNNNIQSDVTTNNSLHTLASSFYSTCQSDASAAMTVVVPVEKKTVETFGQRTSIYRGVTRHRWTGRYEAHLWDNSCRREGQSRKGRQGGYDKEDKAARAYDLAALKYWGPTTTTNFPVSNYEKELEDMQNMSRLEFVASLRRKSSGFSRGASIYRGVTRHHQHGRWQARIGRVAGNKDLYLGTFTTQEEAAEAYDIAAIKFRGLNAVTNFDMTRYDVESIANSNLPIGGINGKTKSSNESLSDNKSGDGSGNRVDDRDHSSATSVSFGTQNTSQLPSSSNTICFGIPIKQDPSSSSDYWSSLQFQNPNKHTVFQSSFTNGQASPMGNIDNYYTAGALPHQSNVSIAFGTPITTMSSNTSYESSNSSNCIGNWVSPSHHTFQTANPNLSVFQTPIFGME